jgi:hypothetical protein
MAKRFNKVMGVRGCRMLSELDLVAFAEDHAYLASYHLAFGEKEELNPFKRCADVKCYCQMLQLDTDSHLVMGGWSDAIRAEVVVVVERIELLCDLGLLLAEKVQAIASFAGVRSPLLLSRPHQISYLLSYLPGILEVSRRGAQGLRRRNGLVAASSKYGLSARHHHYRHRHRYC